MIEIWFGEINFYWILTCCYYCIEFAYRIYNKKVKHEIVEASVLGGAIGQLITGMLFFIGLWLCGFYLSKTELFTGRQKKRTQLESLRVWKEYSTYNNMINAFIYIKT